MQALIDALFKQALYNALCLIDVHRVFVGYDGDGGGLLERLLEQRSMVPSMALTVLFGGKILQELVKSWARPSNVILHRQSCSLLTIQQWSNLLWSRMVIP